MRQLVYNAKQLFADIERRLDGGEAKISFDCELPDCNMRRGLIYFRKQAGDHPYVVGVIGTDGAEVVYNGDNRDFKWLCDKRAIAFKSMPRIFNMFYRLDAIYSSSGNTVVYYVDNHGFYRDGKYVFKLEKAGAGWRAYIERMPDLGGRDPSAGITHRLRDGERRYVCVNGTVDTKKRMLGIAKNWAIHVQRYIETGETFG